ncbi:cache domain-containing sensor histidine kinase [Blautia sp. HCP3S3_C12]|uniref:cache domain-containing sensor histidine kinase n=1 Tax=unclassified Blautia TaxID=2648079 RepID=UPI003F8A3FDB
MKGLKRMKIKTKIWVLFLACILMSSVISIGTVIYSSQKSNLKHIGEMTTQTLHAIDSNLELMIDHVNQDTYAVFWSKMFQDTLEEVSKGNLTVKTRTELQDCLTNIMLAGDYISSIVFYDNIGNSFMCNREEVVLKKDISVEKAYWYDKAIKEDGDWIFETDGGGIVSYKSKNRNILSMIRVIKKKTDYSKLGILMVNIDEKTIRKIFDSVGGNLNSNFYVLMNDTLIFGPEEKENYDISKDIIGSLKENETKIVRSGKNSMVYKKISSMIDDWTIAIETPLSSFSNSIGYFDTIIVLIVNIGMLILCWLFISRTVSKPIQKMEEQMMYSQSIPENMAVDEECEDEITNLKRAYNNLLNSIRELLERTKEEEKIIRKNELDLILEQINPHFLYNTLDVISGLTLIGDQDKSFQMTQALGRFYRNSLNSGCQVITVREELDIIKSYMTIINIRYDNEISIEYEVDESLLDILMLKLILQPLVENAVHHGMRQKEGKGELRISVQALNDRLMEVSVRDNGVGISEDKIRLILEGEYKTSKSGFGLHSVKQRVELFYGIEDAVSIFSQPGCWMEVRVRFPYKKEG